MRARAYTRASCCILLFIMLALSGRAQGQDSIPSKKKWITRKHAVIAGLVIQQAGSFYLEYKWWWEDNYHPFKIQSDQWLDNYSKGIDKAGHFYTSYFYYHLLNDVMKWGGFSDRSRHITAITFPALYAISIELADGFSTFHFSADDLVANFAGIGYGLMQEKIPYLRNFNVKFGYFPSPWHIDNGFKHWSLPEDYSGHSYWLTCNVHGVLPPVAKRFWPEFLNIGIGYGVSGWQVSDRIQREFMIGFDYNLGAIHTKNETLRTTLGIIDKFHFPAPGMKSTGGGKMAPKLLLLN